MQIFAGNYYQDRRGRLRGPLKETAQQVNECYPFWVDDEWGVHSFTHNGRHFTNWENDLDLVTFIGPVRPTPSPDDTLADELRGLDPSPSPPTGRKDDQSKPRPELISPEFIFALSHVLTFGAQKYSDRNWEHGMAWSRVFGAAMRHLWAWWGGAAPSSQSFAFGPLDEETKFSHLWHAACCIMFLVTYEARLTGDDDRWTGA